MSLGRERIRKERIAKNPRTSSESDRDHELGDGGAGDFNDAEDKDDVDPPLFRQMGLEDDYMLRRELVTEQTPTAYRPCQRDAEDGGADLVKDVVRLKVKS